MAKNQRQFKEASKKAKNGSKRPKNAQFPQKQVVQSGRSNKKSGKSHIVSKKKKETIKGHFNTEKIPHIFSEHDSSYYAVLKKLFSLKKKGIMPVSACDVKESIYKPYFPILLERVEEVLEELYNHSILMKQEFANEEVKYFLTL